MGMNRDMHTCQATLDISGSPIDFQWGSRKYPELLESYVRAFHS